MTAVSMFRTTSIYRDYLWYDFGERRIITGIGSCPVLRSTVQNTGPVLWLPVDLKPANENDKEGNIQTDNGKYKRIPAAKYFPSAVIPSPIEPPTVPPPTVPTPVTPPVVVPPVTPSAKYKIIVEYLAGSASVLVGNWQFGDDKEIILTSPTGKKQISYTGRKPEFGEGGFEAGYIFIIGNYHLLIDGNDFELFCDGKPTKVSFEAVTDTPPVDPPVFLRTVSTMTRAVAEALLLKLNALYQGMFRIE